MKSFISGFAFFFLFLVTIYEVSAQKALPFANEINAFRRSDSVDFPGKDKIIFTGSSSFRLWKDLQTYFPGYPIINRAFGGSTLLDMIRYVDVIIYPYDPKQILIYCGDNDLASSDTVTVRHIRERFEKLFTLIRDKYPKVRIAYVSIKPSPSRRRLLPKIEEANTLIKKYLKKRSRTSFINVYEKMFNPDGSIMTDIWLADSLHMNIKGYAIWQKVITHYLKK